MHLKASEKNTENKERTFQNRFMVYLLSEGVVMLSLAVWPSVTFSKFSTYSSDSAWEVPQDHTSLLLWGPILFFLQCLLWQNPAFCCILSQPGDSRLSLCKYRLCLWKRETMRINYFALKKHLWQQLIKTKLWWKLIAEKTFLFVCLKIVGCFSSIVALLRYSPRLFTLQIVNVLLCWFWLE